RLWRSPMCRSAHRNSLGPTSANDRDEIGDRPTMTNATRESTDATGTAEDGGRDLSAPLDVLLTEATYSPRQRFFAVDATIKLGASLARRPGAVARRVGGLARELGRVAAGDADIAPQRGDRRFSDPSWSENP